MKYKKNKKTEASVLVVSLIIMSIVLIASLTIALVAGRERRASSEAVKTTKIFESADKIVEVMLKEIQRGNLRVVNELRTTGRLAVYGLTCQSSGLITGTGTIVGETYRIELLDSSTPPIPIKCTSNESIGNIGRIRVTSVGAQVGRAIEAKVDCNIKNCQQLQSIPAGSKGYYCLANNIECSNFTPIVNFNGFLDGKGFTIKNLIINSSAYATGLFTIIGTSDGANAVVKNLGIEDANVSSSYDNGVTGILAGVARLGSRIENCYTTGEVESTGTGSYAGGLVGYMPTNSYLIKSYSTADVSATTVGGLIGAVHEPNWGSESGKGGEIRECYYGGSVGTGTNRGGLLGQMANVNNFIKKSYYNSIKNNLIMACGIGNNLCSGGAGKTSTEMEAEDTYNGWDFSGTWRIKEGESYPCFQWQGECPQP